MSTWSQGNNFTAVLELTLQGIELKMTNYLAIAIPL
jgi:hypothetical protein